VTSWARIGLTGQSLSVDGKLSGPENLAMFGRLHPPGLAGRPRALGAAA